MSRRALVPTLVPTSVRMRERVTLAAIFWLMSVDSASHRVLLASIGRAAGGISSAGIVYSGRSFLMMSSTSIRRPGGSLSLTLAGRVPGCSGSLLLANVPT